MAQPRKYYAEEIAAAMERLTEVREQFTGTRVDATKLVADELGLKPGNLKAMLGKAREHGLDYYPSRAS